MKYIHQHYFQGMILLSLLLIASSLQQPNCVFSNPQCKFSFTGEPCLFSACQSTSHFNDTSNGTQSTRYLWQDCLTLCCPAGIGLGGQQTVDYLVEHCGKKEDGSLLPVIIGFSVGVPLFVVILLCLYCKPWNCIRVHPSSELQETRGGENRQKIRSVILESNSYSYDGGRKSDTIINFQERFDQSKGSSHICSICLETNTTVKTQCGHHFHLDCLSQWLNKTPNCPDCRTNNLNKFQLLCCRCYRISRAIGSLDMGPSYTCKWCKILPE